MLVFKVAGSTDQQKLANAIASNIRLNNDIVLEVMGAAAVNTAIKASILARGFLSIDKKDFVLIPSYETVFDKRDSVQKTVIHFHLKVS